VKFRRFGRLDWKVSVLGFGAMRLPIIGSDKSKIDEAEAIKMIRYAIDHGVNYVDSAYTYHEGNSEVLVGKALKDGYRQKVKVATKMPTWLVKSQSDMTKFLNEQLMKLQTDHIDFYLLHGLRQDRWSKMKELNVFEWAEKTADEGKIRHLSFSFHDNYDLFEEIIDTYNKWAFCQIQYNYIDEDIQAGTRGLKYAASKGLGVVIMEPIAGGMLAFKPSKDIQDIWDSAKIKRTPAEWALQWVWNHPVVSVALSGMSSMGQVKENIRSANKSGPKKMTKDDLGLVSKVKKKYLEYGFIGCKDCKYCMPCPQNVEIPKILALCNEHGRTRGNIDASKEVKNRYEETISPSSRAGICIKCGQCEDKCPQQLPIRDLLAKAVTIFEIA